jgi:hypothetical protein
MKTNVVTKDRVERKPDTAPADTCVYYWIIDSLDGPVIKGVCKICRAEKESKKFMCYSSSESRIASLAGLGLELQSEAGDEGNIVDRVSFSPIDKAE